MSGQSGPINLALYGAVRDVYTQIVKDFRTEGVDIHSEAFLGRFPFIFVAEYNDQPNMQPLRERLVAAGFSEEFRARTERALQIFYGDHAGGGSRSYFCDLIDDFLNYSVPRAIGLPDERERFDHLYSQFEQDLFGEKFRLVVTAALENISDHAGQFRQTAGVRLSWAWPCSGFAVNTGFLRDRSVPYFELKKAAHPIGRGTAVDERHGFFVLEFEETRPKTAKAVSDAYRRSEEITSKVVFALRLLTFASVYSDYWGFRMPGHWSGDNMIFMNYPDESLDGGFSQDLSANAVGFERLLPVLLATPSGRLTVLQNKIEDALRRERRSVIGRQEAEQKASVDQLLDYFQALEAIIPIEGSYQIALYAAVLLGAASKNRATQAPEIFQFIKDMHTLRNEVVHGRLDKVLAGKLNTKNKLNVGQLRNYVHALATLYLLNPDEQGNRGLCPLAHRLALGEEPPFTTLYDPPSQQPFR